MNELIKYFVNLLIIQYKNKPRAKGTIEALAKQTFSDTTDKIFPIEVQNAYNLDTAVGEQLDVLGKYIGYDRNLPFPLNDNFVYAEYDGSINPTEGYSDYYEEKITKPYLEYRYSSYDSLAISDDTYRRILKMQSELKNKPLSLANIDEVLKKYFDFNNNEIYLVEGDKTVEYHISKEMYPTLNTQEKLNAFFEKYFPRPMGCTFTVVRNDYFYTFNMNPINGAEIDEDFVFTNNDNGANDRYSSKYFETKEALGLRIKANSFSLKIKFKVSSIRNGLFAAQQDQTNWNYFLSGFVSSASELWVTITAQYYNPPSITLNTWYWLRVTHEANSDTIRAEYSTDGTNYTLIYDYSAGSDQPERYMTFGFGASQSSLYGFSGEIDFKETNITINGEDKIMIKRNKR